MMKHHHSANREKYLSTTGPLIIQKGDGILFCLVDGTLME